jgi:hypothetical protein
MARLPLALAARRQNLFLDERLEQAPVLHANPINMH